jgi:hypothetical protein
MNNNISNLVDWKVIVVKKSSSATTLRSVSSTASQIQLGDVCGNALIYGMENYWQQYQEITVNDN